MNNTRQSTETTDQQILFGISKDLQTMPDLFLGGTAYSPGALSTLIQSRIDAANAVSTAMSSWLSAVHTYQAIDAQTVLTPEQKAAAAAKRAATRKARGTMGPKAKLKVTGATAAANAAASATTTSASNPQATTSQAPATPAAPAAPAAAPPAPKS